jgi:hypothetical protein
MQRDSSGSIRAGGTIDFIALVQCHNTSGKRTIQDKMDDETMPTDDETIKETAEDEIVDVVTMEKEEKETA